MRVMLVAMLVACGAPAPRTPTPPPPAPPPPRDLAVAEPPPKPQPRERRVDADNITWLVDRDVHWRRRLPATRRELKAAESGGWSACVRDYVDALPAHVRRPVTAAFARYKVACDDERRVVLEPSRTAPAIAFVGPITALGLQAVACRAFDRLAIEYDGRRWVAGVLATERRTDGCTVAALPNTPALRSVLREAIAASEAVLRFDDDELAFPEGSRYDLRLMLDALDALSAR